MFEKKMQQIDKYVQLLEQIQITSTSQKHHIPVRVEL